MKNSPYILWDKLSPCDSPSWRTVLIFCETSCLPVIVLHEEQSLYSVRLKLSSWGSPSGRRVLIFCRNQAVFLWKSILVEKSLCSVRLKLSSFGSPYRKNSPWILWDSSCLPVIQVEKSLYSVRLGSYHLTALLILWKYAFKSCK